MLFRQVDEQANHNFQSLRIQMRAFFHKIALSIFLFLVVNAEAQVPNPKDIVTLKIYRSASHVVPGKSIDVAVALNIKKDWHINSNRPISDFVIPTKVEFEASRQFRVIETVYPSHKIKKFQFSDEPMAVFEDTLLIGFRLEITNSTDQDTVKVASTLTYQACNDEVCLFPVEKKFGFSIPLAANPKAQHRDIFSRIQFSRRN